MKALSWNAAAKRFKEVITGRIFTSSSEPVGIADGDLWVDSSSTPILKARVAGTIYEVVGAGGGGSAALLADDIVNEMLVAAPEGVTEGEPFTFELHAIDDTPLTVVKDTLHAAIVGLTPVGYWRLDDLASPPQDSSGNARHASATANVTYRAVSGGGPGMFPTIPLNGTTPVADNNVWTPGASGMTIFFLTRPTALGASKVFLSKFNTGAYEWVIEQQGASGAIQAAITSSAGVYIRSTVSPINTVVINTWQAYCVTISGNTDAATITLYKNGNTAIAGTSTASAGAGTVANGTALLGLGYRQDIPATLGLVGSLAHVAIFTGVLSGANIGTLMNAADADGWF
jgi:Concanavalin A-like lectin/glucanases superfamily